VAPVFSSTCAGSKSSFRSFCYHFATTIFGGDGELLPGGVVEPVDDAFVAAWNEMAIDIDSHLDRMMAELLLHVREAFLVLDQVRGKRMAQIVDSKLPQLSFCQRLLKSSLP